jgi:uroporphyrinogen decarboxylase
MRRLGYDLVRVHLPDSEFRMDVRSVKDTGGETRRTEQGYLVHEHGGPIQCQEDMEKYPWPDIARLDTRPMEWAEKNLPDGMAFFDMSMQVFECATWLMGYESLFVAVYDDPEFVEALLDRIGNTYLEYTRLLCQFSRLGAIWAADDMGFKTQTMASPDWLRRMILPWHARAAAIAHAHNKLYFLHSCGKLDPLFDDLAAVGIDAKHSFEDVILPVEQAYDRLGGRMGILGGLDVDFLSRATEEQVRQRVRNVLTHCQSGGGYALGTGNSVTSYVPVGSYLAMLEEGARFCQRS